MPTDIDTWSATDALRAMARGELGSEELLDLQLALVERLDGELGLVVALDERARSSCRRADRLRSRGETLGLLHGLPITIKDAFETEGLVTTSGSAALAHYVPNRDAVAVARLRRAGAIVFGKTNLPLFGGDVQTDNDVYGLSRNPWDPSRTVGGSSGGAAGALATGMTLLELGSDIGGSIRGPAHYNGVVGHKPTWGAVPARGHIPGPPGSMAPIDLGVVGPLARTARDVDLAMTVLVGSDLAGVPSGRLPTASMASRDLRGLRIGVWAEDAAAPTAREVVSAVRSLADRMADAGAVIDDVVRPRCSLEEMFDVYMRLLRAAMGGAGGAGATPELHRDWLAADERRHQMIDEWQATFEQIDVMVTPCTPRTAFPHDTRRPAEQRTLDIDGEQVPYVRHLVWAGLATLPALPATAVPIGRSDEGLPIGVQVVGPRWGDRTTIAVAGLVEQLSGGFVAPPRRGRASWDGSRNDGP